MELSKKQCGWFIAAILVGFAAVATTIGITQSGENATDEAILKGINAQVGADTVLTTELTTLDTKLNDLPQNVDNKLDDEFKRVGQLIKGTEEKARLGQSRRESNSIWTNAVQTAYGMGIRSVLAMNIGTEELVSEIVDIALGFHVGYPGTAKRFVSGFNYGEPETLSVTVRHAALKESVNPDSATAEDSVFTSEEMPWIRPFNMKAVEILVDPRFVDPLYAALINDWSNLQQLYVKKLSESGYNRDNLPSRVDDCLVLALENVLENSADIDFDAELRKSGRKFYFVNAEYENWSSLKKQLFRIGQPGTQKIREVASMLLANLEADNQPSPYAREIAPVIVEEPVHWETIVTAYQTTREPKQYWVTYQPQLVAGDASNDTLWLVAEVPSYGANADSSLEVSREEFRVIEGNLQKLAVNNKLTYEEIDGVTIFTIVVEDETPAETEGAEGDQEVAESEQADEETPVSETAKVEDTPEGNEEIVEAEVQQEEPPVEDPFARLHAAKKKVTGDQ